MKRLVSIIAIAIACVFAMYAGKDKTKYRNALVLAYSPVNAVYEDDNIKLEIYNEQLYATNKTSKTIFIDLSQCFLINNGSSYPMFSVEQNEKYASKKGVSSSIEEFLSIAPSTGGKQNETFICRLAGSIYGQYSTTESPSDKFSEYDERLLTLLDELSTESLQADPKGKEYLGTTQCHLTEDESISNIGASIAYAFNKRSEEWTTVIISTWVSDVIFAPYYVEVPDDMKDDDKRGFAVKKTKPSIIHIKADSPFEFEEDKSPLIVCDWTGDYERGTFTLAPTNVKKTKKKGAGAIIGASLLTIATGGLTAGLLLNNEDIYYKKLIHFDGEEANWGKLSYLWTILKNDKLTNVPVPNYSKFKNDHLTK